MQEKMEQVQDKSPRIEVVDSLRGFAVVAILLVHNLEHFIFPVYPDSSPAWVHVQDQGSAFSKAVGNLRYYGKMSLTNYVTQSILGAFIYFPFGLYLAPYCGYTVSLLIGIFTFFLQLLFCKWWLGKYKQGPLEYIWHRWTWIGTDK